MRMLEQCNDNNAHYTGFALSQPLRVTRITKRKEKADHEQQHFGLMMKIVVYSTSFSLIPAREFVEVSACKLESIRYVHL